MITVALVHFGVLEMGICADSTFSFATSLKRNLLECTPIFCSITIAGTIVLVHMIQVEGIGGRNLENESKFRFSAHLGGMYPSKAGRSLAKNLVSEYERV